MRIGILVCLGIAVIEISARSTPAAPPPRPPANNYHPPVNNNSNNNRPPVNNYRPPVNNNNFNNQAAIQANLAQQHARQQAEQARNAAAENARIAADHQRQIAAENARQAALHQQQVAAENARRDAENQRQADAARARLDADHAKQAAAAKAQREADQAKQVAAAKAKLDADHARQAAADKAKLDAQHAKQAADLKALHDAEQVKQAAADKVRLDVEHAKKVASAKVHLDAEHQKQLADARLRQDSVKSSIAAQHARVVAQTQKMVEERKKLLAKQTEINGRLKSLPANLQAKVDLHQKASLAKKTTLPSTKLVSAKTIPVKLKADLKNIPRPILKSFVSKQLADKAKSDPKLQTVLTKLNTKVATKSLTKSDLTLLKSKLNPGSGSGTGLALVSQAQLKNVANIANTTTNPAVKNVLNKYLQNPTVPLSAADQQVIQKAIDADIKNGKVSPARIAALSTVLRDSKTAQNNLNVVSNLTQPNRPNGPNGNLTGGLLGGLAGMLLNGGGVLGGGGSGGGFDGDGGSGGFDGGGSVGGGGAVDGGSALVDGSAGGGGGYVPDGSYIPPEVPTVFYPNNPSATIDPNLAYPSVPGIAVAVTPPQDITGSGGGFGTDQSVQDLGSVALDATPWQSTRYVRLANGTAEKVTFHLRYLAPTDSGDMAWLPAAPDDESGDWSVVELDPGETVDLTDGDWQVNANQMYAWAQSESGQNWDQFRSEPLNLVPEPEGQYQSAGLEVFNFTLH